MKQKYLVQRRDGSVPKWPWFVLGARDPAALVALQAYADEAEKLGMDEGYVEFIRRVVDEMRDFQVEAGPGDPDKGGFRDLDPEIAEKMGAEGDEVRDIPSDFTACHVAFDTRELAQPFLTAIVGATVLDDEKRVLFRDGTLFVANMRGLRLTKMPDDEVEEILTKVRAYRGVIDFLAPHGGLTQMTVKNSEDTHIARFETSFGFRQLVGGFEVGTPVDLLGKEIVYKENIDGIMDLFMPWEEWVAGGREEFISTALVTWT